jgi:hypothetical protein
LTEEDDEIVRATAHGTLRYAIEYYAAAKVVAEKFGDSVPAQFLIGHSIELALKAFLLHQTKSSRVTRSCDAVAQISINSSCVRRGRLKPAGGVWAQQGDALRPIEARRY